MADVQAFRGWRYDMGQVGSLSDVVAPPYDVIGPDEQEALYQKHPCNVIRLILNRDEPGDQEGARYERVANFLKHWKADGILQQEREDALYVYHQGFDWEGIHYVRRGFLGRIRLEEFGEGKIFPHEQTMSGPKADRLALLKAGETNLSPIFGLFPDDEAAVQTPLEQAIQGLTPLEVTDDLGVLHRLWPVSNRAAISEAVEHLRDKSVFIADGHHRYETALNYRRYRDEQGSLGDANGAAQFVMMHLVGMNDPGLAILPTHRLISGLPDWTAEKLEEVLGNSFDCERVGNGDAAAQEVWEMMEVDGGQDVFGFGTAVDGEWIFARLKDDSLMESLAADKSPAWRGLGVSLLHVLVLDHLVAEANGKKEFGCKYVHLMDEVNSSIREKNCQLACLVAPASIEHVQEIASSFEKMPPKSTFFYPKLLSGLVFNSVK